MSAVLCSAVGWGDEIVRASVEPGVSASIDKGLIFVDCYLSSMDAGGAPFRSNLANADDWRLYDGKPAFAVSSERLTPEYQRKVLLALFPNDTVDGGGWWHAPLNGQQDPDIVRTVVRIVTGSTSKYKRVMADPHNQGGQNNARILIPAKWLLPAMAARPEGKEPLSKPPSPPAPAATVNGDGKPPDLDAVTKELTYGKDDQGPYAMYRLKPGEALFTAVVVRFTDIRDYNYVLKACETVRKRSGIKNVKTMPDGQKVLIPLEMLSDRYTPKGSAPRQEFEATVKEAKRLRKEQVHTKQLEGVVVVIDPGHGGRDQGGKNAEHGLYEAEINYDIACRVKRILESQTRAKVYMTLREPNMGFDPRDCRTFHEHNKAQVLTTPHYENYDAKISANLRWYLANSIYRKELKNNVSPRKMVFTSFHTDVLYDATMRGAMVYIPGAKYRREQEKPSGPVYAKFEEVHEQPCAASSASERRRDEALSRNFAEDLMQALGQKHIRRHMEGDWIRSQIRQDGGKVYVPSVLRNTLIPTKVLIEVANLKCQADCENLANPQWRQHFAEAYVQALKKHFGA